MSDLCEYELDVLRECANRRPKHPVIWGAAMSVALESLQSAGLIDRCRGVYFATEKGFARLEGES